MAKSGRVYQPRIEQVFDSLKEAWWLESLKKKSGYVGPVPGILQTTSSRYSDWLESRRYFDYRTLKFTMTFAPIVVILGMYMYVVVMREREFEERERRAVNYLL